MYKIGQLAKEIRAIVDGRIKRNMPVQPDWVVKEILDSHQEITGNDSDFYFCVAREAIRDQVRKQINRFRLSQEQAVAIDKQIVLPGFERLQRAYLIEIRGKQIAVPLEKMTSLQRQAKIAELQAMGDGCFQHAEELERYDSEHPAPPCQAAA